MRKTLLVLKVEQMFCSAEKFSSICGALGENDLRNTQQKRIFRQKRHRSSKQEGKIIGPGNLKVCPTKPKEKTGTERSTSVR